MKCYVTYEITYALDVPEEDLNELYYDDEEEDSLWADVYDPNKVDEYFNNMSIDWSDYYDTRIEKVDLPNDTIHFY